VGADAARGLRRRARHLPEGAHEGARQFAGPHQRRLHLSEEADFGEAIEHLSKAIRLDNDKKATLYAHFYLGLVYSAA